MTAALQAVRPPLQPDSTRLDRVPFHPQAEYQCGPAALAMALGAAGTPVDPAALVPQVYLPARAGSLQPEMLAAARRHGRLAVVLPPRLDGLLAEVAAGTPVIVLQNLALPIAPRWHYAVLIGYDLARGRVTLHSGTTAALEMPLAVFERTWARSGHWAMVAVVPDRLPATVDDAALLAAAAALERVDAAAAARSYAALTQRSPALAGAWLGLGNARHAGGDLAGAALAFERAARSDPAAADAWNNLALTLLALGRAADAAAAAQRAVQIGGPRLARYRDTQAAVERALAPAAR